MRIDFCDVPQTVLRFRRELLDQGSQSVLEGTELSDIAKEKG
jgi:hypothetical protein